MARGRRNHDCKASPKNKSRHGQSPRDYAMTAGSQEHGGSGALEVMDIAGAVYYTNPGGEMALLLACVSLHTLDWARSALSDTCKEKQSLDCLWMSSTYLRPL